MTTPKPITIEELLLLTIFQFLQLNQNELRAIIDQLEFVWRDDCDDHMLTAIQWNKLTELSCATENRLRELSKIDYYNKEHTDDPF